MTWRVWIHRLAVFAVATIGFAGVDLQAQAPDPVNHIVGD